MVFSKLSKYLLNVLDVCRQVVKFDDHVIYAYCHTPFLTCFLILFSRLLSRKFPSFQMKFRQGGILKYLIFVSKTTVFYSFIYFIFLFFFFFSYLLFSSFFLLLSVFIIFVFINIVISIFFLLFYFYFILFYFILLFYILFFSFPFFLFLLFGPFWSRPRGALRFFLP